MPKGQRFYNRNAADSEAVDPGHVHIKNRVARQFAEASESNQARDKATREANEAEAARLAKEGDDK